MKFNPKEANKLIPDGEYDAQIKIAEETQSKAGNPMFKLTVKVWALGGEHHIFDYAVIPSGLWKIKQICEGVGLMDKFDQGAIEARDIEGKTLRVFVKTHVDKTGGFPDKNVIAKYVPPMNAHADHANTGRSADDDLPF